MLNYIWLGLIVIAVLLGAITGQLHEVTTAAFDSCKSSVMTIALPLAGVMALWLGIMRLAEKSGLVEILARALRPVLKFLFPEVPANHPAMGSIVMNVAANMLGLGNAATPLGLRAMQGLEKLNPRPGIATNAMCTFLAINTSSVQLIPATAVGILAATGSKDPTRIIGSSFIATSCATAAAIIAVKLLEKLPFYALPKVDPVATAATLEVEEQPVQTVAPLAVLPRLILIATLLAFGAIFVLVAFFPAQFHAMADAVRQFLSLGSAPADSATPPSTVGSYIQSCVETLSLLAIPFILTMFPLYAAFRKVPVYEEFVEGAKEGFQVAIRIIPYLIAILVAVGMFRAAGGIQLLANLLKPILAPLQFPPDLLPLVLVRPLSGGAATGMFAELVHNHGPDSLIATMGGTVMGSTETTFYVLAVYFGSVAIRRTRHALPAGLIADFTGVVVSVLICNLFFR